jgi:Protein of unknown function (DUF732)
MIGIDMDEQEREVEDYATCQGIDTSLGVSSTGHDLSPTGAAEVAEPVATQLGPQAATCQSFDTSLGASNTGHDLILDDLAWSSNDDVTELVSYRGRHVSAALVALVCVIATVIALLVSTLFDDGDAVVSSKTTEPSVIPASELPSISSETPESPVKPLVAVPDADHLVPPPPPTQDSSSSDQDDDYLSLLRQHGINIVDPAQAVRAGRQICAVIARPDHPTLRQVITWLQQSAGVSYDIAEDYVLDANVVYCPQFDNP